MVDDLAARHLLAAIDGLQRRIDAEFAARFRSTRVLLRGSEGRILDLIAPEGTRPSVLAEGWISKQAMSKRIEELERRGLVESRPDASDGRAVVVHRTPEGDRVHRFTIDQIADLERAFAELVGEERYRVFRDVLDELGTNEFSVDERVPTTRHSAADQRSGSVSPARPTGRRR